MIIHSIKFCISQWNPVKYNNLIKYLWVFSSIYYASFNICSLISKKNEQAFSERLILACRDYEAWTQVFCSLAHITALIFRSNTFLWEWLIDFEAIRVFFTRMINRLWSDQSLGWKWRGGDGRRQGGVCSPGWRRRRTRREWVRQENLFPTCK